MRAPAWLKRAVRRVLGPAEQLRRAASIARVTEARVPVRLVVRDPPILHGTHLGNAPLGPWGSFAPVQDLLRFERATFLVGFTWDMASAYETRRLATRVAATCRRFPRHRFVFLGSTEEEVTALAAVGLAAIWCNHNAFIDERIYRPLPDVAKTVDAIYNARLKPFKRHELARDVGSLALLTAHDFGDDPDYREATRARLAHARWLNPERHLTGAEVNRVLAEARVGLCLSAREGAMYASAEYLLAGLPVVSTRSRGGRDVFFDPRFTRVVADDPRAVADAVRELADAAIDPELVRASTLARMAAHRERFMALVRSIGRHAPGAPPLPTWDELLVDKMSLTPTPLRPLLTELGQRPLTRAT